jgi:two-component sensor histidine kinase/sensor domain CHASE-containing protein
MTLYKKTLVVIGITITILIVVLFTASQLILLASYADLEEQNTLKNAQRVQEALLDDIDKLESADSDWASWDDSYAFVQDGNKEYINSNLRPATLKNLRINFILYYNLSGNLVYGKAIDLENGEEMPIPASLPDTLAPDDILVNYTDTESSLSGITLLDEGPVLIASQPILTSETKGPIQGTLIMGRYLDSAEIERLSQITHLSLSQQLFNDNTQLPADFEIVKSSLSKESPIIARPLDKESTGGYILLHDIYNEPVMVMRAEMPRDIYQQGRTTMQYFIMALLATGLIIGIVNMLFLERNVLSRLANLSKNVGEIGESEKLSTRLSMSGNDELSSLTRNINGMLEKLEQAEDAKKKELLLQEIHHRVKNNLQVISSLLNLQSRRIADKEIIEMLKDSQNRIKSMALIHEKLYNSGDFTGIDFKEYLRDLVTNLFRSYGVDPNHIKLKMEIDDVFLSLDSAIPCGLLINELVSNSLKYAFPDGKEGEIYISIHPIEDNRFFMTVRDNGVGFPADIDITKSKTLGLQLVDSLVDQLDGTMKLNQNAGTEYKITFKELKSERKGDENGKSKNSDS